MQSYTQIEEQAPNPKITKIIYFIFTFLGIGSLLPFNCIIVPVDFWMAHYTTNFLTTASLSYNAANLIVIILIQFIEKIPYRRLIPISLYIFLICLILIPCIYPMSDNQNVLFWVTLLPVIGCGAANGLFFISVITLAGQIDPINSQGFMAGNGIAGLIPEIVYIIIKGISTTASEVPDMDYYSTLAYFIISALFIIGCVGCWYWLLHFQPKLGLVSYEEDDLVVQADTENVNFKSATKLTVLKQMWMPAATIFLIFFITLTIFPTITQFIPCNFKDGVDKDGWYSIYFMSLFLLCDWVGRSLPKFKFFQKLSIKWCFYLAVSRLVFFLLFPLEAFPKYVDRQAGPYIPFDIISSLTMVVFALSNGYISSMTMIQFPRVVNESDLKTASNMQTLFLNSGLFVGGIGGLLLGMLMK